MLFWWGGYVCLTLKFYFVMSINLLKQMYDYIITENQESHTEHCRENETSITWSCVLDITVKTNV